MLSGWLRQAGHKPLALSFDYRVCGEELDSRVVVPNLVNFFERLLLFK